MRRKIVNIACKVLPAAMALFFVAMPVVPCIYDEPEEEVTLFPEEWLEAEDPIVIDETAAATGGMNQELRSGMPCELEIARFSEPESEAEETVEESAVTEETPEIQTEPAPETEAAYEQKTGSTQAEHETGAGVQGEYSGVGERVQTAVPDETQMETDPESDRCEREPDETACGETDSEVVGDVGPSAEPSTGTEVQPTLCEVLLAKLEQAGIGWWYPYAWAQAQAESSWNPNAVSPDGLDYGLFQFRLKSPDGTRMYWTEPESIMDPYAQIRVYTERVAARLNAGLSIEETISRHYTSDYVTEINWEYVNAVLSWIR